MQIVHLVVEIKRCRVAVRALSFAEENVLAAYLARCRSGAVEATGRRIQLGRWREVEHVLHLRHVTDLNAIEDVHPFLDGVNLVSVEIGRSLLKFGEVLDGTQAALGTMNLLIEDTAEAGGVQPEPALLRSHVGVQMELTSRVAVDMAVQAGDAEARIFTLPIVGGVELFLRKRRDEQP